MWLIEYQPAYFWPLCITGLQGKDEPDPQVPLQDAQQLVLPVQNKTGWQWADQDDGKAKTGTDQEKLRVESNFSIQPTFSRN